ncbi:MAG: FmdB family transcriptional regulator [Opitutaceae bacterium]|nr:FmdB family transcriptional regulator [Opitutaceae bacterium]
MPIYEYYCPDNHTIYQFYAKTLAQGQSVPKCPAHASFRMRKVVSAFAITSGGAKDESAEKKPDAGAGADPTEDARMEAAMGAMEKEFSSIDENDPKAMARMMRRMSELTGERIDGEMEEVVRKLEEGADPDSLEEQLGGGEEGAGGMDDPYGEGMGGEGAPPADPKEPKHRFKVRRTAPRRDPNLYDYE